MPELPEVETIKTALADVLVGSRIQDLKFYRKDLRDPIPISFLNSILKSQKVEKVERRSKYILIGTKKGQAVVHLGMTGVFNFYDTPEPQKPHTHIVLSTKSNRRTKFLHYVDPRRFGRFGALGAGADVWFSDLGPEPLDDFDYMLAHLYERSRNRKQTIKAFIMDPKNVVGVGNIYVAESLYRSRISPMRPAGELSKREMKKLAAHIFDVLKEAIEQGGTSFRDFQDINGEKGYFRIHLDVYGREGESCRSCSNTIIRENIAGRSSFYCRKCQK